MTIICERVGGRKKSLGRRKKMRAKEESESTTLNNEDGLSPGLRLPRAARLNTNEEKIAQSLYLAETGSGECYTEFTVAKLGKLSNGECRSWCPNFKCRGSWRWFINLCSCMRQVNISSPLVDNWNGKLYISRYWFLGKSESRPTMMRNLFSWWEKRN